MLRRMTLCQWYTPEMLKAACFITLTCAVATPDCEVRKGWHRVQAWLHRHGYDCYLVTSAIQTERRRKYGDSVLHYHVIVLGHKRVPVQSIRATWRLGATYHETARNPTHAVRYIASYMKGNNGRLTWSYGLLRQIPGATAPMVTSLRYDKATQAVQSVGWGTMPADSIDSRYPASWVYVPALQRIVPKEAILRDKLTWTCYRLATDWSSVRDRIEKAIREENEFIDRLRKGAFFGTSDRYPLVLGNEVLT